MQNRFDIFFPLDFIMYKSNNRTKKISPKEAVIYKDYILNAVKKQNSYLDKTAGLASYIDRNVSIAKKIYSIYPSVEVIGNELFGVMNVIILEPLSNYEIYISLFNFIEGQNSDGYGEGFEQNPIETPDGKIYVSFWKSNNYYLSIKKEVGGCYGILY